MELRLSAATGGSHGPVVERQKGETAGAVKDSAVLFWVVFIVLRALYVNDSRF